MDKKQLVCLNCKNSIYAKDSEGNRVCPVCCGHEFKAVELPETVTCTYCKREKKVSDVLKIWIDIPFFNSNDNTYYDGCHGWN